MGKSKKLLCICRNHKECSGVSAVFQVLNDKRSTFVELPPTRLERRLSANLDLAQSLRAAYLRHLDLSEESIERLAEDQQYYVASHHFDPSFVKDATVCKKTAVVCRTIQREIALSAGSTEQDQFKDGTYFVVPSYPFEKAKLDATNAFKAFRLEQQSKLQEEEQEQKVEPNVQAPTPPPTTVSTNKTTSTTSTSKDDDDHIFYDSASEGDYNMSDPSIGFASPHSANRNVEIFQDDASAVSSSHQSNKSVESYLNQSLRSSSGPVDLDEEVLSVDDGDSLTTGRREEDSKLAVVTPEHAPRRYEEEKKSCEEHDQTASLVVATKDENGPFLLSSSPAKVVTPCGEEQQQQSPVMRLKGGGQWTDDDNDEEGSDKNHSEVSFDHESSEADIAQVDEAQEKAAKTRQELASNDSKELATTKKDTVPNKGSKDQTSPVVKAAHESEVEGVRGFNPFDDEEPDKVGMQAYKPSPKATDEDEHKELDDSFLTPPLDRSNEFVSLFESEMQRRKWTEKEIAAMSKEWRYYKSMIKRMTMETEWVQGLLERSHNSAVTYSDMLKAIHNDSFLDESDKVVLDPKRRHKLAEKREKAEQQRLQTTAGPSLLEPLLWAILGAAEKVDENLSALEEELIDMTNLADEVQQRSAILADAGAMAMGDMERMEATMQKAWCKYSPLAGSWFSLLSCDLSLTLLHQYQSLLQQRLTSLTATKRNSTTCKAHHSRIVG